MPDSQNEHEKTLVPQDGVDLDAAADTLAELIVEAVEQSLERSGGIETHGPAYTEEDLVKWLRGSKSAKGVQDIK